MDSEKSEYLTDQPAKGLQPYLPQNYGRPGLTGGCQVASLPPIEVVELR